MSSVHGSSHVNATSVQAKAHAAHAATTGRLNNGMAIKHVRSDHEAKPGEPDTQMLPPVAPRNFASHTITVPTPPKAMSIDAIAMRGAHIPGVTMHGVQAGARALLSGKPMPQGGGRAGAATRLMSLHLALACTEDGVSDDQVAAMLTHAGRENGERRYTPQDLAGQLRATSSSTDEQARKELLDDIIGALDTSDEEKRADYENELLNQQADDSRLMKVVRKAQGIPDLHDEANRAVLRKRREEIANALEEYETSPEGRQALAMSNATPVAAETADPGTFLNLYTDLVTTARTFAQNMKLLVSRVPLAGFKDTLVKLQRACSDDMGAATSSHDLRWLGATLTQLGELSVLSTLVDKVNDLAGQMDRLDETVRIHHAGAGG